MLELEGLTLEYETEPLVLRSGEWGTIDVLVTNTGNATVYCEVECAGAETSGGSRAEVEPSNAFPLEPGRSRVVSVGVLSRARLVQEEDISDVKISIKWGPNGQELSNGGYRVEDPYAFDSFEYEVVDEYPITGTGPNAGLMLLVLILVVILTILSVSIYIVWRRRSKGGNRGTENR